MKSVTRIGKEMSSPQLILLDYRKQRLILSLIIFSFKVFNLDLCILYFARYMLLMVFMT